MLIGKLDQIYCAGTTFLILIYVNTLINALRKLLVTAFTVGNFWKSLSSACNSLQRD